MQRSPHPGSFVQVWEGADGATKVLAEHIWDTEAYRSQGDGRRDLLLCQAQQVRRRDCSKTLQLSADEVLIRGRRYGRVCKINGIKGVGTIRADFVVAGCGRWLLQSNLGNGSAYGGKLTRVVGAFGRSLVLGVHDFEVHPVIMLIKSDEGDPVHGEKISSRQGESPRCP